MSQNEYQRRRQQLMKLMAPGAIAVLPSSRLQIRNRDTEHLFRQSSDFYYLTGFEEPNAVLLLAPRAAAEARRTLADSANSLRDATTDQYDQARRRVVATVDEVVARGAGVRNDVADAIGRGAREVERVAVSVKTVPPAREL